MIHNVIFFPYFGNTCICGDKSLLEKNEWTYIFDDLCSIILFHMCNNNTLLISLYTNKNIDM